MKKFIIASTVSLYVFAYVTYQNSPTELELWCKDIVKNKELIFEEPLGKALIEVCSDKEHLNTLNNIVYN